MNKTCITFVAAIAALPLFAEIKMGAPFTDGAVLQRGMKVPVWGKVTPAQSKVLRKVRVEFAGQEKTAVVGKDGVWR
ncbi:MAG: 9-O-acetylesterase, partial [Kiritimatiellae bacterium]|nr:9-O-acetylesterase [Kiritimatiellia bacterium]